LKDDESTLLSSLYSYASLSVTVVEFNSSRITIPPAAAVFQDEVVLDLLMGAGLVMVEPTVDPPDAIEPVVADC
jgi:hypothetical protein